MPLSHARTAPRPTDIVIPDCCNLGVVLRTLIGVNAAAFGWVMLHAIHWRAGMLEFAEVSIVVELSCLWSLFAMCLLRRSLPAIGMHRADVLWAQRLACVIAPAVVTAIVVYLFTTVDWLISSFVRMTLGKSIMLAALFGALFQHYFELRTRAFSPALVEARLQALQARIRPHFLFNSLNAVLSLIRTEPQRAETTLEDLADLFRVLMSDPRSMTTLEQEIRLCEQYLSIEQIRLGERLQVTWASENLDSQVMRKSQIPVLLLQPLLENAVHYGVEPASGPTQVQIHMSRSLDRIEIVVINPYHGEVSVAGNHMALENIRERLALLYDVEGQLTTRIARGFFEVKLRFPYVKGAQ
ncbi:histidine kinase [Noviherbaspirillum saxi]|uniref:Histidine kinase n=2 Tax=Noviherbaspirillum saxi TaxID=2320863 RepID=A0A3A3FW66_9BURK|nr:histidine kinase [Noviherbaspirillum saxi]